MVTDGETTNINQLVAPKMCRSRQQNDKRIQNRKLKPDSRFADVRQRHHLRFYSRVRVAAMPDDARGRPSEIDDTFARRCCLKCGFDLSLFRPFASTRSSAPRMMMPNRLAGSAWFAPGKVFVVPFRPTNIALAVNARVNQFQIFIVQLANRGDNPGQCYHRDVNKGVTRHPLVGTGLCRRDARNRYKFWSSDAGKEMCRSAEVPLTTSEVADDSKQRRPGVRRARSIERLHALVPSRPVQRKLNTACCRISLNLIWLGHSQSADERPPVGNIEYHQPPSVMPSLRSAPQRADLWMDL